MEKIAVIDVETTGLSPWRHDRIVEIGIVVMRADGTVETEYETLINPCRDIGPTSIHRISSGDLLRAPQFSDVAGDVLAIVRDCQIIAGHNVSFDKQFLIKEYERLDIALPKFDPLCTCRLFGRGSLQSCCMEFGIDFEGMPHCALADARATSRLVAQLCSDDPSILEAHRLAAAWPTIESRNTPTFCRAHAEAVRNEPPGFLVKLMSMIRHDVEAEMPNVLAYMALIDRVLEDRVISSLEEEILVEAANNWQLSHAQIIAAHANYIHNLAVAALADGVVTDTERRDLHLVTKLLGQDDSMLDKMLESAQSQLSTAKQSKPSQPTNDLAGKSVCFTGQLLCTINGRPITRDLAEVLATGAGLTVMSSVTKKLDLLVVADPNTQSGKAKKARDYGTRVLSDAVFWRLAGITVD